MARRAKDVGLRSSGGSGSLKVGALAGPHGGNTDTVALNYDKCVTAQSGSPYQHIWLAL